MPNLEEHCKHSLKHYGVEGREIHAWLDQPCRTYGKGHRQFRHDTETIKFVGKTFGDKYGRDIAENIALDHIMLDHREGIKRRNEEKQEIYRGFTDEERREFYSRNENVGKFHSKSRELKELEKLKPKMSDSTLRLFLGIITVVVAGLQMLLLFLPIPESETAPLARSMPAKLGLVIIFLAGWGLVSQYMWRGRNTIEHTKYDEEKHHQLEKELKELEEKL